MRQKTLKIKHLLSISLLYDPSTNSWWKCWFQCLPNLENINAFWGKSLLRICRFCSPMLQIFVILNKLSVYINLFIIILKLEGA